MFIVELEDGVWLAPWQGDPGRTLDIHFAKLFKYRVSAEHALDRALSYRKFANAKVIPFSIAQQTNGAEPSEISTHTCPDCGAVIPRGLPCQSLRCGY